MFWEVLPYNVAKEHYSAELAALAFPGGAMQDKLEHPTVRDKRHIMILVHNSQRLVAWGLIQPRQPCTQHYAGRPRRYLLWMYVRKKQRRRGIGRNIANVAKSLCSRRVYMMRHDPISEAFISSCGVFFD